jgi:hypothetical protein
MTLDLKKKVQQYSKKYAVIFIPALGPTQPHIEQIKDLVYSGYKVTGE